DSVNDNPVEAKVGDEGIAAVRRKTAPMGMRGVLAIPDHLGGALVLRHRGGAGFSLGIEGQQGDRTASILGGEEEFPAGMDGDMGGAAIAGGLEVEKLERTVRIDAVGGHTAHLVLSGNGVEFVPVWMQGQEAGRPDFMRQLSGRKTS